MRRKRPRLYKQSSAAVHRESAQFVLQRPVAAELLAALSLPRPDTVTLVRQAGYAA